MPVEDEEAILRSMGANVRKARLRQNITMQDLAQQAGLARTTLIRIEAGHPGTAIGAWLSVLRVLGLEENFVRSLDAHHDLVGIKMQDANLPRRARAPRKPGRTTGS